MYLLTQVYLISLYLNQYMNSNDQYPTTLSQNQLDVLFAGCNLKIDGQSRKSDTYA